MGLKSFGGICGAKGSRLVKVLVRILFEQWRSVRVENNHLFWLKYT